MELNDFHVHSHFSGDCHVDMRLFIEEAIQKNIQNLCFTDHHDLDFPLEGICFELDIERYFETLLKYKNEYQDKINLLIGIELGIQPHIYSELEETVNKYPFDFVLASNHLAGGKDPYQPEYYKNLTQSEGYGLYFNEILRNVKAFNAYDVYGHLDYVIRYGPFEKKGYLYDDYKDLFDELLTTIIENGKGIELNTSGFKHQLNNPHPNRTVINRYRELGGEIITLGSDSHTPDTLSKYFDKAREILLDAGFKYYTIFKNRKPEFIKL
jgi:histidinol-phosphatase (PHP family)